MTYFSHSDSAGRMAGEFPVLPGNSAQDAHTAHFYLDDNELVGGVGRRLAAALEAGGAAMILARLGHRKAIEEQLASWGLNLKQAALEGRWAAVDAEAGLAEFMEEGWPDARRFFAFVGSWMDRLGVSRVETGDVGGPVALFGEMVAVLWEDGKPEAAIRLEELWNEMAQTRHFQLSCGWPLRFFARDEEGAALDRVCAEHNRLVPGQGYEDMDETEQHRNIVAWQQKAQALEEEKQRAREAQQALEVHENQLREFLENAVVGMQWLTRDGTILWANRAQLGMLGYEAGRYIGHNFGEFVEQPAPLEEMLERLRAGANQRGCELQVRGNDGALHWLRVDASAWMREGKFEHARCFVMDITEKKEAEEAQMKLGAIVESSNDAIVSKDLRGIVTSWNAAAERILGYTAEEMIGRPITTVIPPELHKDEVEILRKIQAGERIEHFETVRVTKSGELIDVSLTISPVRDRDGKIVGAAKILRDVTTQKKLEAALRTTERLASVGRMAATVAHEINNPLEAVMNLMYLACRDPELPEQARMCLATADEELKRVSHIARQTLGFYRDTAAPGWIAVREAVEEMLAIYERRMRYKQIELRKCIDPGLRLYALEGAFKQVVANLISNAIDASPEGGALEIRAWQSRHGVTGAPGIHLVVADEGPGIAEPIRQKIFAPFFTTKKDVGTGLGLWIVKSLLLKAGGSIRCRSRVAAPEGEGRESGTTMMVFLPSEREPTEQAA